MQVQTDRVTEGEFRLSVCLCLQRRCPLTGWDTLEMNPLALLPRGAVQTNWQGKACEGESLRSRGRAQRAAGEWRAPWNMLASASGGGRSVRRLSRCMMGTET